MPLQTARVYESGLWNFGSSLNIVPKLPERSERMAAEDTTASQDASRILIVDDDVSVRNVLKALLTAEGYEVTASSSATEALALVGSTEVHLVISDM